MRILHVISTLSPASGGTTEVLRGLPLAQMQAGHQVTVCTTNRDNPDYLQLPESYFQTFYPEGIEIKAFPVKITPLLIAPDLSSWLSSNIRNYDIVHIHGLYRYPPSIAARHAYRTRTPFIISPHGSLDPYIYRQSSRSVWLKRLYEHFIDIPNLRHATAIHYTAKEEQERSSFLNLGSRSFIVPNGLDWSNFESLPPRGLMRARLGLGNEPIILFLGRLHPVKGLDILIPAFQNLSLIYPDIKLIVAGPDGGDYGQKIKTQVLESKLGNRVFFIGALHGQEVLQAYVDADIFTLPSYSENFGMTVAEAMACGIPVVISDQVKIHKQIGQAGAGLITSCSPSELSSGLQRILENPELGQQMGNAGRNLVRARYTWNTVQEQLSIEYNRAIKSEKRNL